MKRARSERKAFARLQRYLREIKGHPTGQRGALQVSATYGLHGNVQERTLLPIITFKRGWLVEMKRCFSGGPLVVASVLREERSTSVTCEGYLLLRSRPGAVRVHLFFGFIR
jgi:hypothetical protein